MSGLAAVLSFLLLCAAPHGADSVWLDLNVPAYRLELLAGDRVLARYEVAPGAPRYPTPRGRFEISRIEWNPWWIPPDRDWARRERPTPPGPANPMGRVKLFFRPLYFLHGTPYEHSIGTAASHGCVRMHNADAVSLAEALLRATGSPYADSVRHVLEDGQTRRVMLSRGIPIRIRYDLAELREDSVVLHRDIYGQGGLNEPAVLGTFAAAGLDTSECDRARLRELLRRAARETVRVPIGALFTVSPSRRLQP